MDDLERVELLVAAEGPALTALASRYAADSRQLAEALMLVYDKVKAADPARAAAAARAVATLAAQRTDALTSALAHWIAGKAALQLDGRTEEALAALDAAVVAFEALGDTRRAAEVQVNRLHALALLGSYDEATESGLRARELFLAHGQEAAAGQIELNLGNLSFRRDRYAEAEAHYRQAHRYILAGGDPRDLARVHNNLALTLTWLHRFREAEALYQRALAMAEAEDLTLTQAEIECNIGNLALLQGRYDRALDYLERSRRRYVALEMPHEAATVELELADAYLELNLAPEAAALYGRLAPSFARLGLRFEEAWATAHHGRAAALLGDDGAARRLLVRARRLFAAEENPTWVALVRLAEAQLCLRAGRFARAERVALLAATGLRASGNTGQLLLARWLRGEACHALGRDDEARTLLEATLHEAEARSLPQLVWRCCTSLGRIAASVDRAGAEVWLTRATAVIEALRAPLPAEEFRVAFVADKLVPYNELVRLCLEDAPPRAAAALAYVERGRSRALADLLDGAVDPLPRARDEFERAGLARLEELRAELNWCYSQVNRPPEDGGPRSPQAADEIQTAILEREEDILALTRQLQQRGAGPGLGPRLDGSSFDLGQLQPELGADTALVEYFSLDGELLAFIVTDAEVAVVRALGSEIEVEALAAQLRFQTDALRGGVERIARHLPQLERRARHYLARLYDILLRPLMPAVGDRRLVVVPYRALHYVPFHALHDGDAYVIEGREVAYAPSALALSHCLSRPAAVLRRAVLLGVPDERVPRVRDEVLAIAPLFPQAEVLLDEAATGARLRAALPAADVLHLACHGRFRPDSPLFSALRLADGWMTVRDAYGLELSCDLIALSACETGVSAIAPGDELLGLARGFLSAGAASLLVSLWPVDDAATAEVMAGFYRRLLAGERPAAALRAAQCALIEARPHPFFWSPFTLIGRW